MVNMYAAENAGVRRLARHTVGNEAPKGHLTIYRNGYPQPTREQITRLKVMQHLPVWNGRNVRRIGNCDTHYSPRPGL
jgi:hypothetical protein